MLSALVPLVYDQMKALARRKLRREVWGHALDSDDLVHEAYIRMAAQTRVQWSGRGHVMAMAATSMRRILVDHARKGRCTKRGRDRCPLPVDPLQLPSAELAEQMHVLGEALERLHHLDPRRAQVVRCRFFQGLTEEETAQALGISVRTTKRDWVRARMWLHGQLSIDD